MKKIILIILILFLAVSCKDQWIGKTLPANNYPQFSPGLKGHHSIIFGGGKATLDYDWSLNEERNIILLDGTFEINIAEFNYAISSTFKDLTIIFKVFHLDQNYTIIGVNQIFIPLDNDSTVEDYKFNRNFPYRNEYKYVSYRMEASGLIY
jgi:hypothetical protein